MICNEEDTDGRGLHNVIVACVGVELLSFSLGQCSVFRSHCPVLLYV